MKQLLITAFICVVAHNCEAQSITWGTPIAVSSGATGNLHPRIQLNRAGNPVVLWGKMNTAVYFSKWTGSTFSTPLQVNSTSIDMFSQTWAGPDLATFGDTVYVAMKHTPEHVSTNYTYLSHSYDGGGTFSSPVRVDNIDTNMSRFPIVTTTSTGNPLVAFMKFNASFNNASYVVSKSTDYGVTFGADVLASGTTGDVCDCCPASIISSGSKAVMLFRNNLSNIRDIWAGVSNDGGTTFTGTMACDNTSWMIMSCPSSGPDGFIIGDTVYSTFMSAGTGSSIVYLSKSSLSAMASASTTPITGLTSGITLQNFPRMANTGSTATAVWRQNSGGMNMLCYSFANNIVSGFTGFDTLAMGSGIVNADVAMAPNYIHVVYEDDNTGKVMYVKGTYGNPNLNVGKVTADREISVYPNPATNEFYIGTDIIKSINASCLIDAIGRKIDLKFYRSGNKAKFNLNGIAKGDYQFVVTDDAGKTYHSKLIVE